MNFAQRLETEFVPIEEVPENPFNNDIESQTEEEIKEEIKNDEEEKNDEPIHKRKYEKSYGLIKIKVENEPQWLIFKSVQEMADKMRLQATCVYVAISSGKRKNFYIKNNKNGIKYYVNELVKLPAYINGLPLEKIKNIYVQGLVDAGIEKNKAVLMFFDKVEYDFKNEF